MNDDARVRQRLPDPDQPPQCPLGDVQQVIQLPVEPERPGQPFWDVGELSAEVADQLTVHISCKIKLLQTDRRLLRGTETSKSLF